LFPIPTRSSRPPGHEPADDALTNVEHVPPLTRLVGAAPLSRRAFGQTVGAAVISSTLGRGFTGTSRGNMTQTHGDGLCYLEATRLAAMIRSKQVSAREV
jgi:hypothetical protein